MPKTYEEKAKKREEKRVKKALARKEKKITKYMNKRKEKITPEQLKLRIENRTTTEKVISSIQHLNQLQNDDYREIKYLRDDIKKIEKRRREREMEIYKETKRLQELNPGSCGDCGLFGGHEPYGCDDDVDDADSSCEEYIWEMNNDMPPVTLRWTKEPTDEYVRKVYEKCYYSDCD